MCRRRSIRLWVLAVGLVACQDPKVDQARAEIDRIAAKIQVPARDEGSMTCRGFLTHGSPDELPADLPRTDPWGHAYTIDCGNGYQVVSVGPDGAPDTKDDLRSAGRRDSLPP